MDGVRTVELLRDLVTRLHHQPRRKLTLLVGIDGLRAAGKTTLTMGLAALDPTIVVVSLEDFYRPTELRVGPRGGEVVEEMGADIDWRRLRNQVLLPLQRNRSGCYQRYDWTADVLTEWHDVPSGGIVLVEGVFACMKQLSYGYDFQVWVDAPIRVRRARVSAAGGEAPDEDLEHRYVELVRPAETADLLVDGSGAPAHDPARDYVRIRPR
jgi:uridine kinase